MRLTFGLAAACTFLAATASAQSVTPTTAAPQASAPSVGVAAGEAYTPLAGSPSTSILDVLKGSGEFTVFLKAADAANLDSVLQGAGHLTVFAPTDAAFAALPPGQLDELMKPANVARLQQFVLLHVVNLKLTTAQLTGKAATNVPAVATGKAVHLDGSSGKVKVDDGDIAQADVVASNGVIQVIDRVLSPDYTPPAATADSGAAAAAAQTTTTPHKATRRRSH